MKRRIKKIRIGIRKTMGVVLIIIINIDQLLAFQKNGLSGKLNNITDASNEITNNLTAVIDPLSNILIAVGGVGAIGAAYSVYSKWQNGDEDAMKRLGRWLGAGIFLLAVGLIVKTLFAVETN